MDLVASVPVFNLYNNRWKVFTHAPPRPPAKLSRSHHGRTPEVSDSLICDGSILSGTTAHASIIGPETFIGEATLDGAIVHQGVQVGEGAQLRRCVIDKNVIVPPGELIGVDLEHDRSRGLTVSEHGVVVVPKGYVFDSAV